MERKAESKHIALQITTENTDISQNSITIHKVLIIKKEKSHLKIPFSLYF